MCPACNTSNSMVLRTMKHDDCIYRRRKCVCGKRYSTAETAPPRLKMPVESTDRLAAYNRQHTKEGGA